MYIWYKCKPHVYPTSNSKHVPKVSTDLTNGDSEKSTFLKKNFFSRTRGYFMMRYMYLQYTIHMYLHVDQMSNLKVITNHPKVITKVVLTLYSSTYVCKLGKWFFICILMIHDEYSRYWLTSKNNIKLYFFASHIKRSTFLICAVKAFFVWSLEIRLTL